MSRQYNRKSKKSNNKDNNDTFPDDPFANDPFFNDSINDGFPFMENPLNSMGSIGFDSSSDSSSMGMMNDLRSMRLMGRGNIDSYPTSRSRGNNDNFATSYTMTSYSKTNDGEPEIYKESRYSKRDGDIMEDQRRVMDSKNKVDKMHHARSIGEKGHKLSMIRDTARKNIDKQEDFNGFQQEELNDFNQEWINHDSNKRGQQNMRIQDTRGQNGGRANKAIMDRDQQNQRQYYDDNKSKRRSHKE